MKAVTKRRIGTIASLVFMVLGVVTCKKLSSMEKTPQKNNRKTSVPGVVQVPLEPFNSDLGIRLTGRLTAKERIELVSEVNGRLKRGYKPFKEGQSFNRGEVLFSLDNSDGYMQLLANRSSYLSALTQIQADILTDYPSEYPAWKNYISNYNPEQSLASLPEVNNEQLKNFLVARNIYNQYYAIKAQENQLAKFTFRAPFNGVVENANINPMSMVRSGQKMGDFIGTESFEMEVGLPVNDRDKISIGQKVRILSEKNELVEYGVINRISEALDPNTQSYKLYVDVESPKLSEGMYLNVFIPVQNEQKGTRIPTDLLVGDSLVYILASDSTLATRNVQLLESMNEFSRVAGIKSTDTVLKDVPNNISLGTKVKVIKE